MVTVVLVNFLIYFQDSFRNYRLGCYLFEIFEISGRSGSLLAAILALLDVICKVPLHFR